MKEFLPFNKPFLAGPELKYMERALEMRHTAAGGAFTKACEELLQDALGVKRALLTTSCTDALEMAALLLKIQPGDEVVVPSYTFVSVANAFALRGAVLRFADIEEKTLCLDLKSVHNLINSQTRAIVAVHYSGVGAGVTELQKLAASASIDLIEDNAHGLFASWQGKKLGSFGRMSALSFHETKTFSCGEGGALLLENEDDITCAEIFRDKGTNRRDFLGGKADKYTWVSLGSSFAPSDLLAAFLLAQLEKKEEILQQRQRLWKTYQEGLRDWAANENVTLPAHPPESAHAHHIFHLRLLSQKLRDKFIHHLRGQNILSVFHYQPLHLSTMGKSRGNGSDDCPVSERVANQLVRLPLFNGMSGEEQQRVIASVHSFQCS